MMLLAVTLIPLPALAADGSSHPSTPPPVSRITLGQAVAHAAAKTALVTTRAKRNDEQTGAKRSTSFFHTHAGMAALAVMAAGTGYAIYSAKHDRIISPAKK